MNTDRLVRMANQIAAAFHSYPADEAASGIANHIVTFWDPRMRNGLRSHLARGGEGLSELARAAAARLEEAKRQPAAGEEPLVTSDDHLPARDAAGNPTPAGARTR